MRASRNVAVDYMLTNREEFEGWFCQNGEDFDDYGLFMRTEEQQGDEFILRTEEMGLMVDIQIFKFNTTTKSISVYHFPATRLDGYL